MAYEFIASKANQAFSKLDLRRSRHVDGRLRPSVAAVQTECIGGPAPQLHFPQGNLIGVDVELFRQLSQRSIALDDGDKVSLSP
jgi:hypothetical protein